MTAEKKYMPDELFNQLLSGANEIVSMELADAIPESVKVHVWETVDVKRIRTNLKVTQVQFAEILDANVNTIKAWESGRRNPTGPAQKLIRLLDQRPELLDDLIKA